MNALLDADRSRAVTLVKDLLATGVPIGDVLVDVLEASQREVGRLWQIGEISWVKEHHCTAITQRALSEIYPTLFGDRDEGPRLVALHAPGDAHHLGLRMVVDLLEHEGWSTTFLAESIRPAAVPDLLVGARADLLAVSASMVGQIEFVMDIIGAVRDDPRTASVPVVVGGRPFTLDPDLARTVGADATASSARDAVAVCNSLLGRAA